MRLTRSSASGNPVVNALLQSVLVASELVKRIMAALPVRSQCAQHAMVHTFSDTTTKTFITMAETIYTIMLSLLGVINNIMLGSCNKHI